MFPDDSQNKVLISRCASAPCSRPLLFAHGPILNAIPALTSKDHATWEDLERFAAGGRCHVASTLPVHRVTNSHDRIDSSQMVPTHLLGEDGAEAHLGDPATCQLRNGYRPGGKPPVRRSSDAKSTSTHLKSSASGPLQYTPCHAPSPFPFSPISKSGSLTMAPPEFIVEQCHVSGTHSGPIPLTHGTPSVGFSPAVYQTKNKNRHAGAHHVGSPASNPERRQEFGEKALSRASTWQGRKEEQCTGAQSQALEVAQRLQASHSANEDEEEASFVFNVPARGMSRTPSEPWNSRPAKSPGSAKAPKFERDQSGRARLFTCSELEQATNSWAEGNILGKGSFGLVYRGTLSDGATVAIKRLHVSGWESSKEYNTEVQVLSNIHHPNIVNLIGHCPGAKCLVFEYVCGGTLQELLKEGSKREQFDWRQRLGVITGLAQALVALHESTPVVVHRDLKPENVLLDGDRSTKLADVGLARLMATESEQSNCTYTVSGTAGFIDPEGMKTFEISPLADVYAFGLIILQVLLGEARVSPVHNLLESLRIENMSQPRRVHAAVAELAKRADGAAGEWPSRVTLTLSMVALKCIQRDRSARPGLASEVLPVLKSLA